MKPIVFIDGDQGTTGLQLQARLAGRGDLTLLTLPQVDRRDPVRRARAINAADIAILCLPDAAAREAVASIVEPRVRVIDASSAHRVDPGWVYGLPELDRAQADRIGQARRVSNPGCYPTGAIALVRPLVDAGLLPPDHPLTIHAVSGYSGRGRAGLEAYEGAGAASAPTYLHYGLSLEHKHVPEIALHGRLAERPIFLPAYGAFAQGIALTIPLHRRRLPDGVDGPALRACLAERYRDCARVRVLDYEAARATDTLAPQAYAGSDDLTLAVFDHPGHGHTVLAALFDNLGKGAAGAAVQNLDLMLAGGHG